MAKMFRALLQKFYPDIRHKDAGYLATVLSDYASFSLAQRRGALPNFEEVENCYWALRFNRRISRRAMRRALGQNGPDAHGAGETALPVLGEQRNAQLVEHYLRQLFQVEKAVLVMQSLPQLIARTPILVERFRQIAAGRAEALKRRYDQELSDERLEAIWRDWSAQHPLHDAGPASLVRLPAVLPEGLAAPLPEPNGEAWLRAKLEQLLGDIQWWCAQTQVREELFLGQQMQLVGWFCLFTVIALPIYLSGGVCNNVRIVLAVAFFGALGAFISIMRRMHQDIALNGNGPESAYRELTALAYGKFGIGFSLVFGASFALVLMLFFYGEIASSVFSNEISNLARNFFPNFPLGSARLLPLTASEVLSCDSLRLNSGPDLGKLLLWSFIAGFAEKMVPDALNRLARAAAARKT